MRIRTAYAQTANAAPAANARGAARKIREDLAGFPATLVIYFAATDYDPHVLAAEMRDAFPGARTFGCTTAGEGIDGKILSASVVAMAFSAEMFADSALAMVVRGQKADPARGVFTSAEEAAKYLGGALGGDLISLDYRQYLCYLLSDRLCDFSEEVLEKVGERTDVMVTGGIAGEDYKFNGSEWVFYDGQAYKSAVILAMWKPRQGFDLLKTQAVVPGDTWLVITKADEAERIIWEFDGEDAAVVYARVLGVPVESLGNLDFDEHPFAITVDGEPFVWPANRVVDGKGLRLFGRIRQGTRLNVANAGDIYGTARAALEEKRKQMGEISGIIHVNCASRYSALRNQDMLEAFGQLFTGIPSIAFSSYGETYVGMIAMTSTMVLFK